MKTYVAVMFVPGKSAFLEIENSWFAIPITCQLKYGLFYLPILLLTRNWSSLQQRRPAIVDSNVYYCKITDLAIFVFLRLIWYRLLNLRQNCGILARRNEISYVKERYMLHIKIKLWTSTTSASAQDESQYLRSLHPLLHIEQGSKN